MRCIATFETTSSALLFERACRKKGIKAKIVPVPRILSESCGLACEYPCDEELAVRGLCEEKKIDVHSWHSSNNGWT